MKRDSDEKLLDKRFNTEGMGKGWYLKRRIEYHIFTRRYKKICRSFEEYCKYKKYFTSGV